MPLLLTLEEINTTNNDEYSRRAGCQMDIMEKFSTFFGLNLSSFLLVPSKTLQSKDMSAKVATDAIHLTEKIFLHKGQMKILKLFTNK